MRAKWKPRFFDVFKQCLQPLFSQLPSNEQLHAARIANEVRFPILVRPHVQWPSTKQTRHGWHEGLLLTLTLHARVSSKAARGCPRRQASSGRCLTCSFPQKALYFFMGPLYGVVLFHTIAVFTTRKQCSLASSEFAATNIPTPAAVALKHETNPARLAGNWNKLEQNESYGWR